MQFRDFAGLCNNNLSFINKLLPNKSEEDILLIYKMICRIEPKKDRFYQTTIIMMMRLMAKRKTIFWKKRKACALMLSRFLRTVDVQV
jgi:hypothetical protein